MPHFIHPTADVEHGAILGENTRIWRHTHVMAEAVIGSNCVIGQDCFVGPEARIGDRCRIQNHVSLWRGVVLENDVFVGPAAVFTNVRRPRVCFPRTPDQYESTHVGQGATIGANATIVCGHRIGEGALVGAGAVVTSDVPPYALILGVPARIAGWVCACGESLSNKARRPSKPARCSACGRTYRAASTGGLQLIDDSIID